MDCMKEKSHFGKFSRPAQSISKSFLIPYLTYLRLIIQGAAAASHARHYSLRKSFGKCAASPTLCNSASLSESDITVDCPNFCSDVSLAVRHLLHLHPQCRVTQHIRDGQPQPLFRCSKHDFELNNTRVKPYSNLRWQTVPFIK